MKNFHKLGLALQEASPLLLSMGQGVQQGNGLGGVQHGINAMNQRNLDKAAREKQDEQDAFTRKMQVEGMSMRRAAASRSAASHALQQQQFQQQQAQRAAQQEALSGALQMQSMMGNPEAWQAHVTQNPELQGVDPKLAVAQGLLQGGQADAAFDMFTPQEDRKTAAMLNYEFNANQLRSQGLNPPSFEEYQLSQKRAGATQVTNNLGEDVRTGTIPPGMVLVPDSSNGAGYRMEAIPGGPADIKAQSAEAKAAKAKGVKEQEANIVVEDVGRALKIIEENPKFTTGMGSVLSNVPGTDARSLNGVLTTIKANTAFGTLQRMREASPTGGALGAVSAPELRLLEAAVGNLEQSLDAADLARNLERVQDIYLDIIHGEDNRPAGAAAPDVNIDAIIEKWDPQSGG